MNKIDMVLDEKVTKGKKWPKGYKEGQSSQFECMECGRKFKKKIGPKTFEVKCPKCGSTDVEVV